MPGIKRPERERRMNRAEELLITGMSSTQVAEQMKEEFGVKERAAWRYVSNVRKRWREEAEELGPEIREERREAMRRTLEYVKQRGFNGKDFGTVLKATKQLRALDGLDQPKELRLSGALGVVDTSRVFASRPTSDLIAFLRTGRLPPEGVESAEEPSDE